jgi:TetR/AcrR family transcriptional regulator
MSMPTKESAFAPARVKRDGTATQKRLLDAAEREFAQRGYAGARLKDIAAVAGVQTTLIHHYFDDKGGLYRAVLDRALLPTQVQSWDLLNARTDVESLVRGFVSLLIHFHAAHRNLLAIMRHEAVTGSEVLPEILRERMAPVAGAVTRLVLDMQRRGEIRKDLSPLELVVLTVSMAVYPFVDGPLIDLVLPGAVPDSDAALARRGEAITLLLLRALKP